MEHQLEQLNKLVAPFTQQVGIRLQVGQGWFYDPDSHCIGVDQDDLQNKSPTYLAAVLLHEAGHVLITRYHYFTETHAVPWRPLLCNALEDVRVNRYMCQRFPGAASWIHALYQQGSDLASLSYAKQYIVGLQLADQGEARQLACCDASVIKALEASAEGREQLYGCQPVNRAEFDQQHFQVYRRQVWPQCSEKWRRVCGQSLDAQYTEYLAWQALSIQRQLVEPVFLQLIRADIVRLMQCMAEHHRFRALLEYALTQQKIRMVQRLTAYAFTNLMQRSAKATERTKPPGFTAWHPLSPCYPWAEQAVHIYLMNTQPDDVMTAMPVPDAWQPMQDKPDGGTEPADSAPPKSATFSYQQMVALHQNAITQLQHNLASVFVHKVASGLSIASSHGKQLSLKGLYQYHSSNKRSAALWRRNVPGTKPDAAISILCDCSGSMREEKIAAASQALVILCEALDALRIPFAVNGFQDQLIPVKGFSEPLSNKVKSTLMQLKDECLGQRSFGNNQYLYNDDGPCLLASTEELARQVSKERIQVVICDGLVEGRHSTEQDLARAIERAKNMGVTLVGVGIGPQTQHVTRLYPNARATVAVNQFPEVFISLIVSTLISVV